MSARLLNASSQDELFPNGRMVVLPQHVILVAESFLQEAERSVVTFCSVAFCAEQLELTHVHQDSAMPCNSTMYCIYVIVIRKLHPTLEYKSSALVMTRYHSPGLSTKDEELSVHMRESEKGCMGSVGV